MNKCTCTIPCIGKIDAPAITFFLLLVACIAIGEVRYYTLDDNQGVGCLFREAPLPRLIGLIIFIALNIGAILLIR